MSAQQVIDQFKELPPAERAEVAKFVLENDDSLIPGKFKQGTNDSAADRGLNFDTAMTAMANDPEIQRELRSINAEFAVAESDGLGKI